MPWRGGRKTSAPTASMTPLTIPKASFHQAAICVSWSAGVAICLTSGEFEGPLAGTESICPGIDPPSSATTGAEKSRRSLALDASSLTRSAHFGGLSCHWIRVSRSRPRARMTCFHRRRIWSPSFYAALELKNSSRTVAVGGPCSWDEGDAWAEIRDVTVTQHGVVGSSSGSTTVREGMDILWGLDASSNSQFPRGLAEASAVAVVHRTDGTTYMYKWFQDVQLH